MKVRILIFSFFLFSFFSVIAQNKIIKTDALRVFGQVQNPTTFTLSDFDTFEKTPVKDVVIYNHKGEIKDTLTGMSGIYLKTVLASIKFSHEKPKFLNEFYFVFTASDGYKVVFSWNEIYNTELGNSFFIVTEIKGKKMIDLDQRIVFLSTADIFSGRRYIKGLEKIEVKRVE